MYIKNIVVLAASICFYAWGGAKYLFLLLILIVVNYICGLAIEKTMHPKVFLIIGLCTDILTLVFYKYLNFIFDNIQKVVPLFGGNEPAFEIPMIALPIGISFFTFQIISYLIDVYRKEVPAQKNIAWLALYIMMFPQLIAGPIVRYGDVNKEIGYRTTSLAMVENGLKRFILGFSKKIFLANCTGFMADQIFNTAYEMNTIFAWLGVFCYTMQIFYDFSAYSDMAIGLGSIFGFHFNENFNYPYSSTSIKEFWRRWHISLSTWFRDYVYIPLGGNRKGNARTYCNLFFVFLLTGIWHGAAWQFIFWGVFHGVFLLIERAGFDKILKKLPAFLTHIYTMLVVMIGWVFFRASDLDQAFLFLKKMFVLDLTPVNNPDFLSGFTMMFWVISVLAIVASTPIFKKIGESRVGQIKWLTYSGYLVLFVISIVYLAGLSYNPFIYFKF